MRRIISYTPVTGGQMERQTYIYMYIQTDGQMDEHHGNCATIRSNKRNAH